MRRENVGRSKGEWGREGGREEGADTVAVYS